MPKRKSSAEEQSEDRALRVPVQQPFGSDSASPATPSSSPQPFIFSGRTTIGDRDSPRQQAVSRFAVSWLFTTIGSYVPTLRVKNLLGLPKRIKSRFLRPQQIRVDSIIREDGALKKRLIDIGAADPLTPTMPRFASVRRRYRQVESPQRNLPGQWPDDSFSPLSTDAQYSPTFDDYTYNENRGNGTQFGAFSSFSDFVSPSFVSAIAQSTVVNQSTGHMSPLNQGLLHPKDVSPPRNIFVVRPPQQIKSPSTPCNQATSPLHKTHNSAIRKSKRTFSHWRTPHTAKGRKGNNAPFDSRTAGSRRRSRVLSHDRTPGGHRLDQEAQNAAEMLPDAPFNIWMAEAARISDEAHEAAPYAEALGDSRAEVEPQIRTYEENGVTYAIPSKYENDESILPDAPPKKELRFHDYTRTKYVAKYGVGRGQVKEDGQVTHCFEYFVDPEYYYDNKVSGMQDVYLEKLKEQDNEDSVLEELKQHDGPRPTLSYFHDAAADDSIGELHAATAEFCKENPVTTDDSAEDFCATTDGFPQEYYAMADNSFEGNDVSTDDSFDVDGPSLGDLADITNDTAAVDDSTSASIPGTTPEDKASAKSVDETPAVDESASTSIPGTVPEEKILDESLISLELATDVLASLPLESPSPSPSPTPTPPPAVVTIKPLVAPLTTIEYDDLMKAAKKTHGMARTVPVVEKRGLSAHDFGTLLPEMFEGDAKAWLNDNIVNEYVTILVKAKHEMEGYSKKRGGPAPPVEAFSSQWFTTMQANKQGVKRWASRKSLDGEKFLDCSLVLFPICDESHWRLVAIKPQERLIEYYDSLGGPGKKYTDLALEYLQLELGKHYVASEWKVSTQQKSERQKNVSDCGIFTVLNALVLLRGEEHKRVVVTRGMSDARQRVATTLMALKPTSEMD